MNTPRHFAARVRPWLFALALAAVFGQSAAPAGAAEPCVGGVAPHLQEAGIADIRAFARGQGKRILSFVGYSAAGYEDQDAMLAEAGRVLDVHSPARTLINIGATADGIGAVYALARSRGFVTIGIVSSLARDEKLPVSPCVDEVFFIKDATWGGRLPGSRHLSPTSAALVAVSHRVVGIGGGEVARDEMLAARAAGIPVRFFAADMNHAIARDKARNKGQAEPVDFRGAAHGALAVAR